MITLVMAFSNPFGAFLFKVVSPKVMIAVGVLLGILSMVLGAAMVTFTQFVLGFSLLYGLGKGLCYFAPLACGWEWIPERKGFVTGIILGASGLGAFIFSFIAQAIVNPDNEPPIEMEDGNLIYSPEIACRVPRLLYVLAACFSGLGIIAVLLVRRNPAFVYQ